MAGQSWLVEREPDFANEAAFQRKVVDLAESEGWLVCHVGVSQARRGRYVTATSKPGFPDLVLVRGSQLVFLELKMPGNQASAEQKEWIVRLQAVDDVEAYVVFPSDAAEISDLLRDPPDPVHTDDR